MSFFNVLSVCCDDLLGCYGPRPGLIEYDKINTSSEFKEKDKGKQSKVANLKPI